MAEALANDIRREAREGSALEFRPLPHGSVGHFAPGWWGVVTLILTEAFLFAYLLFSYYYLAARNGADWLLEPEPSFRLSGPNTLILALSSVTVWIAQRGLRRGNRAQLVLGLAASIVLGAAFLTIQGFEWAGKPFPLGADSYSSIFFVLTGFHMAHVVGGILILLCLLLWSALGYFAPGRDAAIEIGSAYWHFVDAVWLCVFFTIYVSPYLMR